MSEYTREQQVQLGMRIAHYRKQTKISVTKLAEAFWVSPESWLRLERGDWMIPQQQLSSLAMILAVPVSTLIKGNKYERRHKKTTKRVARMVIRPDTPPSTPPAGLAEDLLKLADIPVPAHRASLPLASVDGTAFLVSLDAEVLFGKIVAGLISSGLLLTIERQFVEGELYACLRCS